MIGRVLGTSAIWVRDGVAQGLARLRLNPNHLTALGCAASVAGGVLIARGRLAAGGLVLIAAALCDVLDGAVARLGRRRTAFGAFFDSSLDRVSDLAIFGGLAVYFAARENVTYVFLSVLALGAAEIVSYTRARAECLIDSCKVGFWERGERTMLVIVGLLAGRPMQALWVLATAPWLTVLRRILHSRRMMQDVQVEGGEAAPPSRVGPVTRIARFLDEVLCWRYSRVSPQYDVVALVVLAAVCLIPLPATDPLRRLLAP
jgi:CDP-diacylglycerol--glycerol-3-phosphate 3-phosphatidyltransferase